MHDYYNYFLNIDLNQIMELNPEAYIMPQCSSSKYEEEITHCLKYLDLQNKICMFESSDMNYYDKDSQKYARITLMTDSELLEYLNSTDYGYFSSAGESIFKMIDYLVTVRYLIHMMT